MVLSQRCLSVTVSLLFTLAASSCLNVFLWVDINCWILLVTSFFSCEQLPESRILKLSFASLNSKPNAVEHAFHPKICPLSVLRGLCRARCANPSRVKFCFCSCTSQSTDRKCGIRAGVGAGCDSIFSDTDTTLGDLVQSEGQSLGERLGSSNGGLRRRQGVSLFFIFCI